MIPWSSNMHPVTFYKMCNIKHLAWSITCTRTRNFWRDAGIFTSRRTKTFSLRDASALYITKLPMSNQLFTFIFRSYPPLIGLPIWSVLVCGVFIRHTIIVSMSNRVSHLSKDPNVFAQIFFKNSLHIMFSWYILYMITCILPRLSWQQHMFRGKWVLATLLSWLLLIVHSMW